MDLHSALNMFDEFSMTFAGPLAEFAGFTATEVKTLCERYGMDFEETAGWYNGYELKGVGEIYNPRSVVSCMQFHEFGDYWNQTESYEALRFYTDMNMDGLRDDVIAMMQGDRVDINIGTFANDMTSLETKDDVMTLLIHLGYLGYDSQNQQVFIPNQEIRNEFENVVARGIEESHLETSHLQYNDENALSYIISLAFYAARSYYTIVRELPTGKGFADLVFLPKKSMQRNRRCLWS